MFQITSPDKPKKKPREKEAEGAPSLSLVLARFFLTLTSPTR